MSNSYLQDAHDFSTMGSLTTPKVYLLGGMADAVITAKTPRLQRLVTLGKSLSASKMANDWWKGTKGIGYCSSPLCAKGDSEL